MTDRIDMMLEQITQKSNQSWAFHTHPDSQVLLAYQKRQLPSEFELNEEELEALFAGRPKRWSSAAVGVHLDQCQVCYRQISKLEQADENTQLTGTNLWESFRDWFDTLLRPRKLVWHVAGFIVGSFLLYEINSWLRPSFPSSGFRRPEASLPGWRQWWYLTAIATWSGILLSHGLFVIVKIAVLKTRSYKEGS